MFIYLCLSTLCVCVCLCILFSTLLQYCKLYVVASYTPSEAEKRWNYLKDCYRKARNLFKKRQALQQKSGAAGTPKSETITPSFRHYNVMTFLNDTLEHRQ